MTAAPSARRRRRRRDGEETARAPPAPDPEWCAPRHPRPHCAGAWAATARAGASPSANRPRISGGRRENRWSRPVPPAASRARPWRASPPSRDIPPPPDRSRVRASWRSQAARKDVARNDIVTKAHAMCEAARSFGILTFPVNAATARPAVTSNPPHQAARSKYFLKLARTRASGGTARSGRANSRPVSFS